MEELLFCLLLGAVASAPVAVASFLVLATKGALFRVVVTLTSLLILIGWGYRSSWRTLEAVFGYDGPSPYEFDGYFAIYLLYALSVIGFFSLRLIRGWRFRYSRVATSREPGRFRFTIVALFGYTTLAAVFAAGVVLLNNRYNDELEFLIAFAVLFLTGGALMHRAFSLASSQTRGLIAGVLVGVVAAAGFLIATKFAIADNLPRGPGVGFPNDDLFGPCSLGFTAGALGVQLLYLTAARSLGWRLDTERSLGAPGVLAVL